LINILTEVFSFLKHRRKTSFKLTETIDEQI